MAPIDLKEFALKEQKLPKKLLTLTGARKTTSTWKILASHFLDFMAASFLASFMAVMFNQSIKMLLTTKGLQHAFNEHATIALVSSMLPMIIFSYFFFSYYLNHGQTWGMHVFKKRMKMKSMNFKDSFYWAAHSLFLCLTGGLFYLAKREQWQKLQRHDYLYHDLLLYKENYQIDLLKRIDEQVIVEEEFAIAA